MCMVVRDMVIIQPFHERLAELYTINKKRPLTIKEVKEIQESLHANAEFVWKMAQLENWSMMAFMIDDMNWLTDICRDIDDLELGQQKKSAPKRKTDRKKSEQ